MNLPELSKKFFCAIEERLGPFNRPFQFQVFPFDAGGSLNFLTSGNSTQNEFVTYISWDLFGNHQLKHGSLGRYELLSTCDDAAWCRDILNKIGRQSLQEIFEPGDTLDIGAWVNADLPIQAVVFEEVLRLKIGALTRERCGLLRCIGVTRPELEFAVKRGTPVLLERLKQAGVYPRTMTCARPAVDLS